MTLVGCMWAVPVLWCVGQRDNNILVDEDEEGQEEAEPHSTDDVHGRQSLKRSHVEDGPVMNFKNWNCAKRKEKNSGHEINLLWTLSHYPIIWAKCLYHCDIGHKHILMTGFFYVCMNVPLRLSW